MYNVRVFSIASDEARVYVVYSKYGSSSVFIDILDTTTGAKRLLASGVEDMDMFSAMACRVRGTGKKEVECAAYGRYLKVYVFGVDEREEAYVEARKEEEYHAYKNFVGTEVLFGEETIIVQGYRFVDDEKVRETVDHSGILLYKRKVDHPFIVGALSKDDIFEETRSNNYRVISLGKSILIHGGMMKHVLKYDIGDNKIESSFV